MRLASMRIQNFKGVGQKDITINFAPITMLFGSNNAGKSTVIQAMLLAREVLSYNNANTNRLHGGGEAINLGGFEEYVHKHDTSSMVSLYFDLEIDELPSYLGSFEEYWLSKEWEAANAIFNKVKKISVVLDIENGFFIRYSVFINGEEFTRLDIHNEHRTVEFLGCNPYVFMNKNIQDNIKNAFNEGLDNTDTHSDKSYLFDTIDLLLDNTPELLKPVIGVDFYLNFRLSSVLDSYDWCIPELANEGEYINLPFFNHLPLDFDSTLPFPVDMLSKTEAEEGYSEEISKIAMMRKILLSTLILGPGKLLKEELDKILYIGPLRSVPQRNSFHTNVENLENWADGSAAWDKIATATKEDIQKINSWLHGDYSLNMDYIISRKEHYNIEVNSPLIDTLNESLLNGLDDEKLPVIRSFLENTPSKSIWTLRSQSTGVEVHPSSMGTGISQVMPIIVASALAKNGGIISIEQPELHIHPKWQVALGDLFIKAVTDKSIPPLFLLETHSEHLMLRFLRRIRETSENDLPKGAPSFTPKDIAVYFIQKNTAGHTEALHLEITAEGDFAQQWPEGFFEERMEEVF